MKNGLNFTDAFKEKLKGYKTPTSEWADEDKKLLLAGALGNRGNALIPDPSKYFGNAETYSRFVGGVPSHKRTFATDQKAINEYLLGRDSNRMDFSSLLDELKESKSDGLGGDGLGGAPFGYFNYDQYYEEEPNQFQYLLNENRRRG